MPDPTPDRLPDFVIVGAPKSGTTSLAAWLGAHPDVFVPVQKELHFFSRGDRWAQGTAWYSANFAGARERLVGEATPTYLDDPDVAGRMAAIVPGARLIALLRDPAERAWSHYAYDRDLALNEVGAFADVVASAGRPDEHRYVSQGRYATHLARFAAHFPDDQVLPLLFDDLRDRPVETWRQVCGFLGLAADPVPSSVGSTHNAHYRLRSRRARALMIRTRAWRRLPFGLGVRLDRLLRDEGGYDGLDPALRVRLVAAYADDLDALEARLGRRLPAGWRA